MKRPSSDMVRERERERERECVCVARRRRGRDGEKEIMVNSGKDTREEDHNPSFVRCRDLLHLVSDALFVGFELMVEYNNRSSFSGRALQNVSTVSRRLPLTSTTNSVPASLNLNRTNEDLRLRNFEIASSTPDPRPMPLFEAIFLERLRSFSDNLTPEKKKKGGERLNVVSNESNTFVYYRT